MEIFRMIDMLDGEIGVLVDLEYETINGDRNFIDLRVHNIINNIACEEVEILPMMKLAFVTNMFRILDEEEENNEQYE